MSFSLKDDVKVVSDKNKEERERTKVPTIRADVTVAHNYSSQSLNSTELAKEKLRQMLAEVSHFKENIFLWLKNNVQHSSMQYKFWVRKDRPHVTV